MVRHIYFHAYRGDALEVVLHYLDTMCVGNLHSQVIASTQARTCPTDRQLARRLLRSARHIQVLHAPVPRPHPRRNAIAIHAQPYVRPHLPRVYVRAAATVCRVCVAVAATWSECKCANCRRRMLMFRYRVVPVYAVPAIARCTTRCILVCSYKDWRPC